MVFKKIGNWFNKNLGLSKLLESKIVLYILVVIGIINIYTYAMEDEFVYAGIMLIVGFLSAFFNKNMIVIIFTTYFELRNLVNLTKNFTILDSLFISVCNSIITFFLKMTNKKHEKKFRVIYKLGL